MAKLSTIPLDQVQSADILELLAEGVSEIKTLDYKRQQVGSKDSEKKEFCGDVASFANASGGDIIFGIEEEAGVPTNIPGLGAINPDDEILRMENIVRSGIEPRIQGIQSKPINVPGHGLVIIIRVPRSWASPHMIKESGKFYSRTSNGKFAMDVQEIRSSFALSESVSNRLRSFRLDRITKILAEETPVALEPGARIILHLMPFISFDPGYQIDLVHARNLDAAFKFPLGSTGSNEKNNFDGILTSDYDYETRKSGRYLQLFRNGIIETVNGVMLNGRNKNQIPSIAFDQRITEAVTLYLHAFEQLGISPPFVVALTLVGVKGYTMSSSMALNGGSLIDRETLIVPEVLVENYSFSGLQAKVMLDPVWNASGWEGSLNFSDSGEWIERR